MVNRWYLKACGILLTLALLSPVAALAQDQPHMRAALEALRRARQELQAAEHDKGGHRAKALSLTDQAIKHVEQGIAYDEKHEGKNRRDRDRR